MFVCLYICVVNICYTLPYPIPVFIYTMYKYHNIYTSYMYVVHNNTIAQPTITKQCIYTIIYILYSILTYSIIRICRYLFQVGAARFFDHCPLKINDIIFITAAKITTLLPYAAILLLLLGLGRVEVGDANRVKLYMPSWVVYGA